MGHLGANSQMRKARKNHKLFKSRIGKKESILYKGPYTNYVSSRGGRGFVKCLRLFTRGVGSHGVVYVNIVYIIDIETSKTVKT